MKNKVVFVWLCLILVQGCDSRKHQMRLDMEIDNSSGEKITDVHLSMGGHRIDFGVIGIGVGGTYMHYERLVTPSASVTWVDGQGKKHEEVVNVAAVYKKEAKESGILILDIKIDSVEPHFKTFER